MDDNTAASKTIFFTQKEKSTFFEAKDTNFMTTACLAIEYNCKDVSIFFRTG